MVSRRQDEQGRLDQVAEAAADMDPQVLLCRDLQHAWQVVHDQADIEGGFERTLQCGRCATRKRQVINSLGVYVGSPKYTYPEHYAAPGLKGLGPLTGLGNLRTAVGAENDLVGWRSAWRWLSRWGLASSVVMAPPLDPPVPATQPKLRRAAR